MQLGQMHSSLKALVVLVALAAGSGCGLGAQQA
jgi:predicted small lipoprotein YifL